MLEWYLLFLSFAYVEAAACGQECPVENKYYFSSLSNILVSFLRHFLSDGHFDLLSWISCVLEVNKKQSSSADFDVNEAFPIKHKVGICHNHQADW